MESFSGDLPPQAMAPFSIMTRVWFPLLLGVVLLSALLSGWYWLVIGTVLLFYGFMLQLSELELSLPAALKRPANQISLLRFLGVFFGLILWERQSVPGWIPLMLICTGLLFDFLDGMLARRIPCGEEEREFGAFIDRESDALALFFIGRSLAQNSSTLHPVFIIGAARYFFGALFLILPLPIPSSKPFAHFSRNVAALAQFAAGAALFPHLVPGFIAGIPGASGIIRVYGWFTASLILVSFLWECFLRVRDFRRAAGPGWRGLLRSFLMYYRLPFRFGRMKKLYAGFVAPGSLVFDVGAHLGNRIPPLLALGARVVAVEPQPGCTGLLSLWYGRRRGVDLVFAAAGEAAGKTPLYVCGEYPTLSSLAPDWVARVSGDPLFDGLRWTEGDPVEVVTLDDLRRSRGEPDFVKIDVEGYEMKVLAGAGEPLKALSFEYLPASAGTALQVIDLLESFAEYRYTVSWGESMRFISGHWMGAEELQSLLGSIQNGNKSGDIYARRRERS
ncbi:FkbM family methyltransferase [Marispirochaeta aestuarii]|uniref:FkbM family methyltransferase n=1 Tax=Marispirochaeta aestuarii TaxID=1963862 RepID=UPI002ABD8B15|nr:FkbM family methyltransferase [Marispirochaeta aestuarii]